MRPLTRIHRQTYRVYKSAYHRIASLCVNDISPVRLWQQEHLKSHVLTVMSVVFKKKFAEVK